MKVNVKTICNWLTELDIDVNLNFTLWIDICHVPQLGFNIFYACEPTDIAPYIKPWILNNYKYFNIVLSHDKEILQKCPNAIKFHWTNLWIKEHEYISNENKQLNVSFICGGNHMCQGHLIRRECWLKQEEITLPKKFFYSTRINGELKKFDGNLPCSKDSKLELFKDTMFHIVMENSRINDYFSEKILDCFATWTVPIYFGCPNINEYFDIRGIIVVNSVDEIISTVNNLTENDYTSKFEYMKYNREITIDKYPNDFNASFNKQLVPVLQNYLYSVTQ